MLDGFTRKIAPLQVLSPEEIETIHRGALFTLETTGIRVHSDRALALMASGGCRVDTEERLVRIPAWLAEQCLERTPSSYLVTARDGRSDLMVGGDTFYFMQGMGMRHVDLDTWETRPATLAEHRDATIVADALDNCHMADAVFSYTDIEGVPSAMTFLETLASGFRYSGKAQHYGYAKGCEPFAVQMAQALGVNLEPELDAASPLTYYGESIDAAFTYVEAGMPIQPCAGITMGAEGPMTTAGSLVLAVATVMGWAVLTQLIKEGAPISIQYGLKPMDMRRGSPLFPSVVNALGHVGMNQMLRTYRIPSCTSAGFTSLSKKFDYQCAYEKALGTLVAALSGGNLHIFQGGTSAELVYHPALSIMDDDIAGWVGRMLGGIDVNRDTLAIDLINEVGPIPGHYLNTAHTREHWRSEHFFPEVADQEAYPIWVDTGKKDTLALARERMDHLLSSHRPEPLTDEQERAIEGILSDARDHYRQESLISDEEWATYMATLEAHQGGS
jgi:trimethylamine--corrinoid protein Co-methyltransferase